MTTHADRVGIGGSRDEAGVSLKSSDRGSRNPRRVILLIDDFEAIRRAYARAIAAEGYVAVEANDLRSGWEAALAHRPHLIVLDLSLPDGCGLTLLSRLRQDARTSATPVLLCSGECDAARLRDALSQPLVELLVKPFPLSALPQQIGRMLEDVGHGEN